MARITCNIRRKDCTKKHYYYFNNYYEFRRIFTNTFLESNKFLFDNVSEDIFKKWYYTNLHNKYMTSLLLNHLIVSFLKKYKIEEYTYKLYMNNLISKIDTSSFYIGKLYLSDLDDLKLQGEKLWDQLCYCF